MIERDLLSSTEEQNHSQNIILRKLVIEVWDSPLLKNLDDELFVELFDTASKSDVLEQVYKEKMASKDIKTYLSKVKYNRFQMKKRWMNSALKEYNEKKVKKPKELYEEFILYKKLYELNNSTYFSDSTGYDSPEELIESKISSLNAWVEDNQKSLLDYPYFKTKSTKVKISSIQTELSYILALLAVERYDGSVSGGLVERSLSVIENPSFGLKSEIAKVTPDSNLYSEENDIMYPLNYSHQLSFEEMGLQVLYKPGENIVTPGEKIHLPDAIDEEIYTFVLSKRDKNFARRSIYVDIGEIVRKVYSSGSLKNYNLVEKRLHNLACIKFHKVDTELSYTFGLFDSVIITKGTNWTAEITLNKLTIEDVIANRTISMYSDVIENFDSKLSKILIYALQYERVEFHSNNVPMTNVYDYTYFSYKVRFHSRSKKENMLLILEALEEMKNKNIAIEDYELIKPDKIKITFKPLSDYELYDLLKGPIGIPTPS